MKPLPSSLVTRLDLKGAASFEVEDGRRNLLPPEPDWKIRNYDNLLEKFIRAKLAQGFTVHPAVEVAARKSRHGLRPVPILGLDERIIYSALTQAATDKSAAPSAGAREWLDFTRGPIREAETSVKKTGGLINSFFPFSTKFRYVVKSDVVAFYRHVDHELLRDQLTLIGGDFEAITYLIDFLGELQGRPVGLPQVNTSSDILAEIYIDSVERAMVRLGHPIWRFNDDFRIACTNFTGAMSAIEDLDRSLRTMGLTLNESKTTTPKYAKYYLDSMGLEESQSGPTLKHESAEDIVGDYTDDFSQDPDSAFALLDSFTPDPPSDSQISLQAAGQSEIRLVRRALSGLAQCRDPRGIEAVPNLIRYIPPVTPSAMRYFSRLGEARKSRTKMAEALDEISFRAATNDWQKSWIIHTYRSSGVLDLKRKRAPRIEWIRRQSDDGSSQALRAYSTWTLASLREIDSKVILKQIDEAPNALMLFYAAALAEIPTEQSERNSLDGAFLQNIASPK